VIPLTNQQFNIKDGNITFLSSLTKKYKYKKIKTQIDTTHKLVEARIVPHGEFYNLEIVYQIPDSNLKHDEGLDKKTGEIFSLNPDKFLTIDLGLNNFCTVANNTDSDFFILNGKQIKAINQWTNKFQAFNLCQKKKNRVWNKRHNKFKHLFHHYSNYIVGKALEKGCKTIIIGKNDGWKQKINIGRRNNQNFVSVPFELFLNMMEYKCEQANLTMIKIEESYTSKCSFLDLEPLEKQEKYCGKRIKRGLFISKQGTKINADLNGALNIARKVFPNAFKANGIEGFVINPYKVSFTC
jgi:putative transposase